MRRIDQNRLCLTEPDPESSEQGERCGTSLKKPPQGTDQRGDFGHEARCEYPLAEAEVNHWTGLSMLKGEVKASSEREAIFLRLHFQGAAHCPICFVRVCSATKLFNHTRDEHSNRLDRL
jgi:hypothetical protein